jgi:flagellar biosynthesis protein FlhF
MRVKRYVVNALPEAVTKIRSDLGKDAVILDTKEVRIGGFLGMFQKKKIEVIAAVESNPPRPDPPARKATPEVHAVVEQILQTAQRSSASSTSVMEPPPAPPALTRASNTEQFIINEIRDLREYMAKLAKQQKEQHHLSEPMLQLKGRLRTQELDEEWISKLIDTLQQAQVNENRTFEQDELWNEARNILSDWLKPFSNAEINSEARVVHFVGPTGVGKTTTIAKLAAEQTIKRGKKVGFITSDTYRIAAVDQLRTYEYFERSNGGCLFSNGSAESL